MPTSRSIEIGTLSKSDLSSVTKIHCAAFRHSALTKLGAGAVYRYYDWQLRAPDGKALLGAYKSLDNTLVGFCIGGITKGATSGFIGANRNYLVRLVFSRPWLLANPLFRERVILAVRILLRRSRTIPLRPDVKKETPIELQRSFGILAIAVDPLSQGAGAGRLLMGESELIARQRGFRVMQLTVHPNNTQAIEFYEHLGWRRTCAADNVWRGSMTKTLFEET